MVYAFGTRNILDSSRSCFPMGGTQSTFDSSLEPDRCRCSHGSDLLLNLFPFRASCFVLGLIGCLRSLVWAVSF